MTDQKEKKEPLNRMLTKEELQALKDDMRKAAKVMDEVLKIEQR